MKLFTHLRHRLLCRLMAAAMVVTSVPPPPAWAAETLSDLPDLRELAVPETLGYLSEVWQPEDGPPQGIVVHIRDLHVHPEAQRHAGELIGALRERYGAELIAVEGAAGECDTTLYSDFPDPLSTGRIARLFLEEGLLTGAEYYGITHPGQVTLWGVEDAPLYDRHLSVYHRNAEDAPPFRETLTQLTAMLEALHDGIYPEPLKRLLRAKAQFDASELTFIGYVKQLTALAVEHQISSSTYPALRSLADASAKPDPAALLAEAGALAAALEERLLATDEQRQLARLTRWHALAQALVESQLQPEEWDRFDTLSRALSAGAVQHFLSEHRDRLGQPLPEQLQSGLSALFDGLPRHEEFYTVAHQRDDAFVRNTLDEMRRRHATAAILVAGGFHTPGITARLRAQRIAYAVIVPAFRSGDTDEALYRARLNNEIPSLQQLITRLDSQALVPPLATAPPAGGGERSDDGRRPTGDQSPKRQDEDSPSAEKHRQTFSRWVGAQAHELLTRVQGGTEKLRQWIADHPRETGLYGIALTAAGTKLVLSVLGTDLPFDDAGTLLAMAPVAAGGMTPESRRLVEAIQETIREEGFDASEEVFVFGSYANGNTHAESDVDLSIPDGGGSPLQARRMVRLLTALKKKGYRFDHDPFWFDEEALLAVLQPRRYIAVSRDGYRFVDRAAERDPGTAPTEDQIRSWMHARTPVRLEWIDLRQKAHASATGYLEQFTTPGGLTGVRFSGSSRDIPVQDIVSAVPAAASGITARRTPGSPTALEQQLDYLAQAQAAFDRGDRTGAARLVSWVIGDHQDEEGPLLGLQRLAADEALSEELRQDAGAALARALNLRERIAAAQAQPQVTKPPTPFGRSLTSLAMGGAYVPQVRAEFATPGRYDEQTAQIARHSSPLEYAWFLKALDQHVGSLDGISVLEAGAGPGAMVERMRAHGLDVRGVEANQDFVAFAQHAGVPLIQGDFFSVPEALAGQTFRLTFSNLFLDALQRSESAPDGSVERRPATHEETLQVLATIAALTMMGGLSIHRIHPGNRLSVTDDELARAGFAVESSDPLRGLLVLRRTALPVPSATAEESAEPERLERFLAEAGVPPGTAPISFSPKNTIWAGRDGRSIVKVFHDFDYGAQRYANEVLYHQPGYNPYPVPIMARDDRLRAIAFDNMRAEGAGLMADALVGARTLDQLVATITAAAGGLARHHARRFETFGWLGRDGPRPVRLNDLQDPSAQRYTSYFEFLFPSMQERLQRLREAGAEPPEEARFLAWAGTVDADRQYVLNHADYNPWNVFLNSSGSIRAVIDGEWIRSGPASRDVAVALVRLLDLSIGHPLLMEHLDAVTGTFLREYRRQAEPLGLDMDALEAALPFHMAYDLVTGAGYQWFDVGDRAKARWLLSLATFYIQRRSIDADRVFPSEDVVFTYRAPDGRTDHQVDVAGTFTQRASQWELSPLRWDPVTGFYQSAPMRLPLGQYEYRFVVDHQWMADPNPHAPRAGDHSLLQVEETHGAEVVHRALAGHLASIHRDGKRPLLSIDLDDTLLPYLANATEETLSVLQAYLQAGGELAFNTLTQRHWLYARLLDELANRLSREGRLGLLAQVSLIVGLEDGRHEIYAWDGEGYRRIDQYQNSKGESLVRLLRHLDGEPVAVLAGYGDAFLDLRSDGSLTGRPEVPLAVNVGKSVPVPPGPTEFINSSRKGPAATLEDIRFATAWLRQHPVPAREAKPVPSAPSEVEWSIESPNPLPVAGEASVRIRAGRPGFVWSWTTGGEPGQGPYLVPLIEAEPGTYAAHLPKSSDAFTFFFSDASTPPGRWLREERPGDPHDFFVVRTAPASSGPAAPPADMGAAELEQLVLQHAPRIQPALTAVKPLGHELMVDVRNAQIDPDLRVVIAHSTFPGDGEGPYAVHNLFVINVHDGSVVAVASIPRYGQREIRNPFQITAHVAGEHYMQRAIVLLLVSGHLDAWYSSDTPSPPARAMYERMGREEPRVSVQPTGRGGYRVTRAGTTGQPMAIPALGSGAAIGLLGGGLVFGGLLVAAWFKQDLLRYADTKAPPLLRRLMAPVRHLPDLQADATRLSAWLWATPPASAVIRRLIRLDNRLDPWRGWIRITVHGTIVATTAFSVAPALLGAGVGIGLPLAMYVVGALVVGVLPAADYLSEGRAQQKRWPVWRVALTVLTIAAGAAARVYISLAPVRLLPRVVRPGAELYQNGRHRAAYALMVSAAFMAGAYHFPAFFLYSVYLDPAAWADLALTVQGVSSALLIKSQWPSRVVPTATVPAQPSIGFPGPVPIAEHPWNRAQQQTAYFSHLNRYTNQMRQLRDDWLPRMVARQLARGDRRLRISVLGPATGEEAASIAATVLDAFEAHPEWGGIETWDVRVTGIERNPDAAAEARRRLTGQSPFAFMPEVPVPAGPPMHAGAPGKARWVQDLLNRHAAWVASHIEILEGSAESAEMLSALGGSDVIFVNATLGGLAPEDYERVAAAIRQGAPQAMVVGTRDELFDQLGSAYRIADRPTANFESSYHVAEPVAPSVSRDGASTRGVIEGLVDFDRLADPETAVPDALRPVVARYVEYMFGHVGAAPASAPPLELFDSSRSPWAAVSSEEHWSRLEGRPLFHLREDEVAVMDQAAFDQAAFDADECLSGCDYLALRFATPQRTSFAVVHFSQPEDYRLRGLLLELFRTRPAGSRVQGIMFRKRAGGYTSAVIRQLEREGALTPGAVEDRTYVSRAGAPANALVVPEGLIHIEYRLNPDVRLTAEGLRHQLATEPVASAAFYRFPWAEAADAGPSPAAPPVDALPAPLSEEDASQLLTVMSAILTGSDGVTRRHTFNVRGRSYGFELGWGSRSARVGPLLFVMLDELMEPVRDPAEQAHGAPAGSQRAAELIARYQRRLGRLYTDHAVNIVFVAPSVDVPGESLNEYTAHMVAEMLGRADAFAGTDVEDAGAGRGFLSVVALRLGARHVTLRDDSAELLAIARLVLQAQGWREGIHFRLAQEDITQPSSAPDDPAHEPTIGLANIGPWPHYGHANHAIMGRWARRPAMRLVFNGGYYFGNAGHEQATANVIELLESNGFDVHVSADTGENDTAPAVLLIATRQPDAPPAAGMVETTTEALETLHRTERDP